MLPDVMLVGPVAVWLPYFAGVIQPRLRRFDRSAFYSNYSDKIALSSTLNQPHPFTFRNLMSNASFAHLPVFQMFI